MVKYVSIQVLNKLLQLPKETDLIKTLECINQLVIFKNNHNFCKHPLANFKAEIIELKLIMEKKMQNYLDNKIRQSNQKNQQKNIYEHSHSYERITKNLQFPQNEIKQSINFENFVHQEMEQSRSRTKYIEDQQKHLDNQYHLKKQNTSNFRQKSQMLIFPSEELKLQYQVYSQI